MSHKPTSGAPKGVKIAASTRAGAQPEASPARRASPPQRAETAPVASQNPNPASTHGAETVPLTDILTALAASQATDVANKVYVDLKTQAASKLENKSPGTKAVVDAVGPQAAALLALTAKEMANDPESVRKLAALSSKVGKKGFTAAMKKLGPDTTRAFAKAAGVEAMNPAVVASLLENLPKAAATVSPKLGATVAKQCIAAEAKFGAKALVKGSATAGKAAPALGNAIAVASTAIAAAGLLKSLPTKDPEKICKEGCNTLLQAVGIAFPWVALGGDLVDLGWTAKIAYQESSTPADNKAQKQATGDLIASTAEAAAKEASNAGDPALAKALSELSVAGKNAGNQRQLEKASQEALKRLAQSSGTAFSEQAKSLPPGTTKTESEELAKAFTELFKVVLHHQKSPKVSDEKRVKDAAQLIESLEIATK